MIRKKNSDVMLELVDLKDRTVLDVGCGDGALTRFMTGCGAHVLGLEISPRQLEKALAAPRVGDERFERGVAQTLPAKDGSVDVVVFANSLHHVPVPEQSQALGEAARVLKDGGVIYVSEPLAEGPFFQLTRLIDDETVVRAKALEAVRAAGQWGLVEERETVTIHTIRERDYQSFRDRMLAIDPDRADLLTANDAELERQFLRLGAEVEDGWAFDQPTRVNLLRKKG